MLVRIGLVVVVVVALAVGAVLAVGSGWLGEHEAPGTIEGKAVPAGAIRSRARVQTEAAAGQGVEAGKQILFGDLHVHTTFSADAFMLSLPIARNSGARPPADACDFARYCSALDFWSINDHAEALTPQHWNETVESMRQCNALSGGGPDPDVVPFLGWEWTQVGPLPESHYGHKNVVLRHLDDGRIPARPIAAGGLARQALSTPGAWRLGLLALSAGGQERMMDFATYAQERAARSTCPDDVPVRDLPADCTEYAETPAELFRKLDDWGHESIVIPHGTSWGFYTPPGSSWDKQLRGAMHDPRRQTLIEVYSGHGNSEEYRDWRAVRFDAQGLPYCPEATPDYLPPCQRAGQIILERCAAQGLAEEECEKRAAEARQVAAEARGQAHLTVSGESAADWLDAGQCRDCFLPSFNHRPGGSTQYITALGSFEDPNHPRRFRMGYIASSDVHTARPGTGYKEFARTHMTESGNGARLPGVGGRPEAPEARALPFDRENTGLAGFALLEFERQASFFLTGGLAAAHARGRDRDQIWQAFERREVYGTSGPRILLWFDLMRPDGTALPMGTEVTSREVPIFRVRAVGSLEQKRGCPDYATRALSAERLDRLCLGECYHPSDKRRLITRIEVVRIRPQASADEPVAPLIEDPWRTYGCAPDPAGCSVTFQDLDYAEGQRDSVYYVRAIEAQSNAVNAGGVRCAYDANGRCVEVDLCGNAETIGDDCLAPTEERAWSSPIYLDWR